MPLDTEYFNKTFEEQIQIDVSDANEKAEMLKKLSASYKDKLLNFENIISILSHWGIGSLVPGKTGKVLGIVSGASRGLIAIVITIISSPQGISDPNIMSSYVRKKCESLEYNINRIFKGETNLLCLQRLSNVMLSNRAMYKAFFEKVEGENPIDYLVRMSGMTHLAYCIMNQDSLAETIKQGSKISENDVLKNIIYKDTDPNKVTDVLLGGFILKSIFKNVEVKELIKLSNENPHETNTWWDKAFNIFYGLYDINKQYRHVPKAMRDLYSQGVIGFDNRKETNNPLVTAISNNFSNAGLNSYYGLALAYFLFYNICTINFQLYVYDRIKWSEYVNNCTSLIDDLTKNQTEDFLKSINVSKYIDVDKFKKFFRGYPTQDLFLLNYSYVRKNSKNIFVNMLRCGLTLQSYLKMREGNPFAWNLTTTKLLFNTGNVNKLISELKSQNMTKWYYVIPTLGLLCATIFILYKLYKVKYRR